MTRTRAGKSRMSVEMARRGTGPSSQNPCIDELTALLSEPTRALTAPAVLADTPVRESDSRACFLRVSGLRFDTVGGVGRVRDHRQSCRLVARARTMTQGDSHMLDSLKTLGAGKGQPSATAELQALIATAREERAALSEMLPQVSLRSTKLAQIGKSLDEVEKKATGATECVEAVTQRLTNLDDRTKGVEEIEARMTQFLTTVMQARQDVETIVGPGSELQKHRDEVQQLSSGALQIQSGLD